MGKRCADCVQAFASQNNKTKRLTEVAPNDWEVSLLDVHISGRALFFHTIGEQQREVRSQFQPVRPQLTLAEAASRIAGNAN